VAFRALSGFFALVIRGDRLFAVGGLSAWDDEIGDLHLHRLIPLVQRRCPHFDQTLIWARPRGAHLEHFAFDMELIPWPHWPRPAKLVESGANNAAGGLDLALDQKPHGEGSRMPAACRQATEDRIPRRVFVEMEWLGIEFSGKSLDLILVPDARIRRSAPP